MDPRFIDDLAQKLSESVPAGLRGIQRDLEGNFKAVLRSALARLDLVTREEFEVQSEVLARTRARLKEFEARIAAMEKASRPVESAAKKKVAAKKSSKKTTRKT